jgi:protein-S-isoprenylcysteine O-methyltransferase Ste14
VLPGVVFIFLLLIQVSFLQPELEHVRTTFPDPAAIGLAVNRVLSTVFFAGVALIYLLRKPPARVRHSPSAVVVSMYASFILFALRPLANVLGVTPADVGPAQLLVSDALVLLGIGFAVYALGYLKLSFSIMPEARALVTGGPYRVVRHPLYLGEITAGLGLVLALPSWFSVVVFVTLVAAQLVRTRYEEDVLRDSFPEYTEYARQTKRLLPWLI